MKREDVGIIYQMNVVPARQRGLIGATLLRAMFDRAAYGCRLFCCWCARHRGESFLGVAGIHPAGVRAGSREKGRVHIFWQRRIRAGDATTPYWFPSRTTSGSIREDRLVFPIPPGVHWGDAMPRVLPSAEVAQPSPHVFRTERESRRARFPPSPSRPRRWAACNSPACPNRRPRSPHRNSRGPRRRATPGSLPRQGNCAIDGWNG